MRIIAGEFKSRQVKSIPGLDTRPTPDRLRESLFSIIQSELEGAIFADLYAGTGSVGLEALSRGATSVIFVERAARAAGVLRQNIAALKAETRTRLRMEATLRAAEHLTADIVFLDPPYKLIAEYDECLAALAEGPAELVLAQHDIRLTLKESYGRLTRRRVLKQGDNAISFYRPNREADTGMPRSETEADSSE